MKFVIIGSAFSGNKGAASMLESSLQTLSDKYPQAQFTLLSMYPQADQKLNNYKNLTVLPAKPLYIGLVLNPLSLIYRILPPLRGVITKKSPQIKAIKEANVLLDQGGITFNDGREIFLLYNIASILPGLFVGTKVIKCAQAMGPFKKPLNKIAAKAMLPRLSLIIARGSQTASFLTENNLNKNAALATDYAFALNITNKERFSAERILKIACKKSKIKGKTLVGISPSVVVKKQYQKDGNDYIELMSGFINYLHTKGYATMLVPHSARTNTDKTHNNDLPLCKEIYAKVSDKTSCVFIDEEVSAQALRHLIAQTELFVACRFHAMVSSLASGVPTLVLGWSHKYDEILDLFGVKNFSIDSASLNAKKLQNSFEDLAAQRTEIAKKLKKELPKVKKLALSHVDLIDKTLNR